MLRVQGVDDGLQKLLHPRHPEAGGGQDKRDLNLEGCVWGGVHLYWCPRIVFCSELISIKVACLFTASGPSEVTRSPMVCKPATAVSVQFISPIPRKERPKQALIHPRSTLEWQVCNSRLSAARSNGKDQIGFSHPVI